METGMKNYIRDIKRKSVLQKVLRREENRMEFINDKSGLER